MLFTYRNWRLICQAISSKQEELGESVIVKHDVEAISKNTLELGKIESECGISAIYYFQFDVYAKDPNIANELVRLGHTIGYHYDVLDENSGSIEAAAAEFSKNIEFFEKGGHHIKEVCPHGNPGIVRKGWSSNKDFFRNQDVRKKFSYMRDLVVDFKGLSELDAYISDAGYQFRIISDISGNDHRQSQDHKVELMDFILSSDKGFVLSTHPHRWRQTSFMFTLVYLRFRFLRKVYFFITKNKRIKTIVDGFYKSFRRY